MQHNKCKPHLGLVQCCRKSTGHLITAALLWTNINNSLKAHIKTHDENYSRLPCSICSKKINKIQTLRSHMLQEHGITLPNYVCQLCKTICTKISTLRTHYKVKHGLIKIFSQSFTCEKCRIVFETEQELKSHSCKEQKEQSLVAKRSKLEQRTVKNVQIALEHSKLKSCY